MIQTVLKNKHDTTYNEVKRKNMELGERTKFGNVALPKDG